MYKKSIKTKIQIYRPGRLFWRFIFGACRCAPPPSPLPTNAKKKITATPRNITRETNFIVIAFGALKCLLQHDPPPN